MRMLGVVDSLVSQWAANPLGWFLVFFPTVSLVFMQEASTPFDGPLPVVASAVAQYLASGGIAIPLFALLRRSRERVSLVTVIAIWIMIGVVRGLVGGLFAVAFADVPGQFFARMITWVVITLAWLPLLAYLFAQMEQRRILLNGFAALAAQLEKERGRARLSAEQLRATVVAAVRDAISPLVAEVRASLTSAAEKDSRLPLQPISDRLESISTTAQSIISAKGDESIESAPAPQTKYWTPYNEALSFDLTRPAFASLLTTVGILTVFIPDAFRVEGLPGASREFMGILGGGIVMYVLLLLLKRLHAVWELSAVATVAAFTIAGVSAVAIDFALSTFPIGSREIYVAGSLPGMFAAAGFMYSATVGIGLANLKLSQSMDSLSNQLADLHEQSGERDAQVERQVSQLMHGPILGRLSACVMALNFYLAEPNNHVGARRTATMEGVLSHLQRISEDFDELELPRH